MSPTRRCTTVPRRRRKQFFWPLSVESFRAQELDSGLLLDGRFSRYFPSDMVAGEQVRLAGVVAAAPKPGSRVDDKFRRDGSLIRNRYDARAERGYSLEESIRTAVVTTKKRYGADAEVFDARATEYFERALELMNSQGSAPVIVLMPVQPSVLAAIKPLGWQRHHAAVLKYLASLRGSYRFELFDFSELSSVGGDPRGYFDGAHMTAANTRKVIDAVLARDPQAFGPSE